MNRQEMLYTVKSGFIHLYTDKRIIVVLIIAGLMAHTAVDSVIARFYSEAVKSSLTDSISVFFKLFGEHWQLAVVALIALYIGKKLSDKFLEKWGHIVLASLIVGVAGVIIGQVVLGGSRPTDGIGSAWSFLNDDNGLSGHAWVGAIPFLAAASITESRVLKFLFYVLSSFCGLSRINDNAHYSSQVLIGYTWSLLTVWNISKYSDYKKTC